MMNIMEPLFDIGYLGFVIALGIRLLLEKNKSAKGFGLMALLLGLGDAFHLIPRVISNLSPLGFAGFTAALSWGEFVTGITMTIFYVLYYHYYKAQSGDTDNNKKYAIYLLAALRIGSMLLPQNGWGTEGSYIFGIVRNVPFALMGLLLIAWTWPLRKHEAFVQHSVLIALSFFFYIVVVLGARFMPLLGLLMIPKTIAYVLLVWAGYKYFVKKNTSIQLLNLAIIWVVLGLFAGAFYREFGKVFAYSGLSALRVVHTHTLVLGFLFACILFALLKNHNYVSYRRPLNVFTIGLAWVVTAMVVRGISQMVSGGQEIIRSAILSGMAGLGHMLLTVGVVWLMVCVRKLYMQDK